MANVKELVYIIGIGCERMNGYFNFSNTSILIEQFFDEEMHEYLTRVSDRSSRFELITTGGVTVVHGLESEFGKSFEAFIYE